MANIGRPIQDRKPFKGDKLRTLRKKRNISGKRLAFLIRCTDSSIYNWELGTSLPDEESVRLLANVLGVKPETFR